MTDGQPAPLPALARRLHLTDAVMIGLGSMIGAGVFAVFAPAAASAGTLLLVGLLVAGVVAFCNATASAQLAAQYPTSGGSYVYGRERLGAWPGFLAGWCFVVGKTASCAAMAMTVAAYVAPAGWQKPVAVAVVMALAAVNYVGVTRTALLTRVIVVAVLIVLAVVVAAGTSTGATGSPTSAGAPAGWYGVLQSAGLLFFAFAGYARIATMGEEVTNPTRTIPTAITTALLITLVVYAGVAVSVLMALGPTALASSGAPLVDTVQTVGWAWAAPLVRAGAAAAALGALLALVAGVSRTTLAMARNRDLPGWLDAVHPRYAVPHHAELTLAVVVSVLVLLVDLRGAIGFSSFGVLLYYLIANAAAWTQQPPARRYPRLLQAAGAAGCLLLVVTLPLASIVAGVVVVIAGVGYRGWRVRTGRVRPA